MARHTKDSDPTDSAHAATGPLPPDVIPAATLAEALSPLRADPSHAAVLLDVDGTLAPIVERPDDAAVPEETRRRLLALAERYGLLACVSGRRAQDARSLVSIDSIAYVGSHGGEVLPPGATEPEIDPALMQWSRRVRDFVGEAGRDGLADIGIRVEDKGAISALHWRGADDERAARDSLGRLATHAAEEGMAVHWGRKVLELRPPVALNKGVGVRTLLRHAGASAALYAGDDVTDLDAFRTLRAMVEEGALGAAVRVGVASDEAPPQLRQEADVMVDGPEGVRELLDALLAD